jgi:hypothetical protein
MQLTDWRTEIKDCIVILKNISDLRTFEFTLKILFHDAELSCESLAYVEISANSKTVSKVFWNV